MKRVCLVILFVFLSCVPHVLAQSITDCVPGKFCALAPIPGLTDPSNTSIVDSDSLANFFNNLYKYAIGVAALLALFQIMRGGVEFMFDKGNVSKLLDAKGRIVLAIWGLVLVLSPALVFSLINPSILNLSLNLPRLTTQFTAPRTAPTAQTNTTTVFGNSSASSNIYVCENSDCTSMYNSVSPTCKIGDSKVLKMYCVPAQSDPNKLSVSSTRAQPDKPLNQTCADGSVLVLACTTFNSIMPY